MTSPDTTTIRVRKTDSERLQALAKEQQITVIEAVHAAIDALDRQEFLQGLEGDYRRLRQDPEEWAEYQAERREFDPLS